MSAKITTLFKHNTWVHVPRPPTANFLGCEWVFKSKQREDGSIEHHKTRLVTKGYTQMEGIDYTSTFSLVIKVTTVRTILSLMVSFNWTLQQLDISNAFLNGTLDEVVFMSQP